MICPGTPTTVESSGTLRSTTEPAPMRQFFPTVISPGSSPPPPTTTPSSIVGCRLPRYLARASQSHALIQGYVITHDRRLADHHAKAVIDEQPSSYLCSGMDFNSGEETRGLRKESSGQEKMMVPQPVIDAIEPDCVQSGIAQEDFKAGLRGGIAFYHRATSRELATNRCGMKTLKVGSGRERRVGICSACPATPKTECCSNSARKRRQNDHDPAYLYSPLAALL